MKAVNLVQGLALSAVVASGFVFANNAQAASLAVDEFNDAIPQEVNVFGAAPANATSIKTGEPLTNVIGGSRKIFLEKLSGSTAASGRVTAVAGDGNEFGILNNGNTATSRVTLTYNANGTGLNLNLGLWDSFLTKVTNNDQPMKIKTRLCLTVVCGANYLSLDTGALVASATPYDSTVALSAFTLHGTAALNSTIQNIEFVVEADPITTNGLDMSVDAIRLTRQDIPEPSPAKSLLALGAMMIGAKVIGMIRAKLQA